MHGGLGDSLSKFVAMTMSFYKSENRGKFHDLYPECYFFNLVIIGPVYPEITVIDKKSLKNKNKERNQRKQNIGSRNKKKQRVDRSQTFCILQPSPEDRARRWLH